MLTNKTPVGRTVFENCPNMKLLCVVATGYNVVDTQAAKDHGVAVCNVPGYSTDSVAQLTLAMAFALSTHLISYRNHVNGGFYSRSGSPNLLSPVWHELTGRTWGIVGCGNIGRQVARVAKAMGCRVLVFRRSADPEFETADLDTLLQQSDVVSIHLPLNDQTRGLISREKLALMKKDAILINVARGAITDEAALVDAMEAGSLGGLGVDVYSVEPLPADHPYSRIMDLPNVIFTPHCAWGSLEARNRCVREVAENILAFARGERRNRVC